MRLGRRRRVTTWSESQRVGELDTIQDVPLKQLYLFLSLSSRFLLSESESARSRSIVATSYRPLLLAPS